MHVDEVGSLFCMRLVERYGLASWATPAELYVVVLAPIARLLPSTESLWLGLRVVYALLLLGLCAALARSQRSLPGKTGFGVALLLAVSYVPLFRHGFEVRHDHFFALGLVALHALGERAREGRATGLQLGSAGAMLALIQACSFKAVVTLGPLLLLAIWLVARVAPARRPALQRALGATALGFALGAAISALTLHAVGALDAYLDAQRFFRLASTAPPYRLKQLPVAISMLEQAPLHAALALVGAIATLSRPRSLLTSTGLLPLLVAGFAWLSVLPNPTLFPYNSIWLSVPVLLLAAEGLKVLGQRAAVLSRRGLRGAGFSAVLLGAGALWYEKSFDAFRLKTFAGQLQVVAAVEALTRPHEPVLDMTGLVASRPPPAAAWMVHSLLAEDVRAGRRESLREIIRRVAPPVAVTGQYRRGLVEPEDRRMLAQNYVLVTSEIDVLGSWLPERGTFEILRSGPYGVDGGAGTPLGPEQGCVIDGRLVRGGERIWLERGEHASERRDVECRLRWLAPAGSPEPRSAAEAPLFERPTLPGQR